MMQLEKEQIIVKWIKLLLISLCGKLSHLEVYRKVEGERERLVVTDSSPLPPTPMSLDLETSFSILKANI